MKNDARPFSERALSPSADPKTHRDESSNHGEVFSSLDAQGFQVISLSDRLVAQEGTSPLASRTRHLSFRAPHAQSNAATFTLWAFSVTSFIRVKDSS
ncbi:hypothetical protein AVEN_115366-1 [Araneus ventricosus]|uniref:Uncharacterized protein n=1 Tax=Araneus ventricosus TaxID=182803 RepID=A0A4Y1ZZG3_ARAVE|nr:hypothetical protein AVEN_115366-1 [Araneus ventricosus]